jgi:broad specificity phosphatase PhoE
MAHLFLVRHAQASFFGADYDALSPLGLEQAAALGQHWARHGLELEAVFIGPRRRHLQTCERVAAAYRAHGLPFPEPVELAELDEHHGASVIAQQLGRPDAAAALYPEDLPPAARERAVREFFRDYDRIMRDWARGTVGVDGAESWAAFRARSLRALDRLCSGGAQGHRVAFTSGGLVSSAAGWLLGLDEERVIDLSIALRNTALTEVLWSGKRRSLISFNSLPHLPDHRAATSV